MAFGQKLSKYSLCNPQHAMLVSTSSMERILTQVASSLLVQGLGVGGGGRNVGVTGSLVRASGELELVGGLEVSIAGGAVGGGVILKIEKKGEHCALCWLSFLDGFLWAKFTDLESDHFRIFRPVDSRWSKFKVQWKNLSKMYPPELP
jgi:hypothetical protein